MIDVTPGELPSSITGQREGALALLADQRDLGGPFRDFRCLVIDEKASYTPSITHLSHHLSLKKPFTFEGL